MQTRRLGNTDLQVSLLCLGTMTWGEQNSEAEAHAQLDRARAAGINFIDTAEMYPVPPKADTQGATETILGNWLARQPDRDQLVIASKVTGRSDWDYLRGGPRLSAAHIDEAIAGSLKRLRTDTIDLYQVHWPERSTNYFGKLGYQPGDDRDPVPIEETLAALVRHQQAGRIRHIGLSNETPWGVAEYLRICRANGWPAPVSIQNPYNLLNRSFEVGLAEFAHREQVGLLAYSPLAFGVLSGKYLDGQRPEGARLSLFSRFARYTGETAERCTRAYVELARSRGLDPAQMALAYINSRPFVTANIIGATTLAQLDSNLASIDLTLDDDTLQAIEAIHRDCPNPCP